MSGTRAQPEWPVGLCDRLVVNDTAPVLMEWRFSQHAVRISVWVTPKRLPSYTWVHYSLGL